MYWPMGNLVCFIVLLAFLSWCNGAKTESEQDKTNLKNEPNSAGNATSVSNTTDKRQNNTKTDLPLEVAGIMKSLNVIKDESRVKQHARMLLKNMRVSKDNLESYILIAYEQWMVMNKKGTSLPCKIRQLVPPHNDETKKAIHALMSMYKEYESVLSNFKDHAFVCEDKNKNFLALLAYHPENNGRWIRFDVVCMHDHTSTFSEPYIQARGYAPSYVKETVPVTDSEKTIGKELVKALDENIKSERKVRRAYLETPFVIHSDSKHEFFTSMLTDNGFSFDLADGGMPAIMEKIYTPAYKNIEDKWIEISEIHGNDGNSACKVRLQKPDISAKTADKIENLMRVVDLWNSRELVSHRGEQTYFPNSHALVCEKDGEFLAYIAFDYNEDETEITVSQMVFRDDRYNESKAVENEIGTKFLNAWDEAIKKNKNVVKVTKRQKRYDDKNELLEEEGGFKKSMVSSDGKCENVFTKIYPRESHKPKGIPTEDLKKIVTCPVCQDILKEPNVLPCGHTVCEECYNQMYPKVCPECRADACEAHPSHALKQILAHPKFAHAEENNAKNECVFEFFVQYQEKRITVKGMQPSDSVAVLESRMAECTYVDARDQKFIYGGKELSANEKLSDHNVQTDVTLHLTRRGRF